jgi:cytochrome c
MKTMLLKKSNVCSVVVLVVTLNLATIVSSSSMEIPVPIHLNVRETYLRDDVIPPVTTLSFDPETPDGNNDWYVSTVTSILNATDDVSGVNSTFYRINEGLWERYEYPFVLSTSNYYTVYYYSIDLAGNVEDVKSGTCKVDGVPPVTTYHVDQGVIIMFYLLATDDMSGVYRTYIQIDGGAWQTYTGGIMLTTDSSHIIKFYSVDYAGNLEDIKQVTISPPDHSPPTLSITVEKILLNKWKFRVIACDADSGMERVEFYVDDQLLGNITSPGPIYEWNWTCPDSMSHLVQAIAFDRAGNFAKSDIIFSVSESHTYHHQTVHCLEYFIQFFKFCRYAK